MKKFVLRILFLALLVLLIVLAINYFFNKKNRLVETVLNQNNYRETVGLHQKDINRVLKADIYGLNGSEWENLRKAIDDWAKMEKELKKFTPRNFKNRHEWQIHLYEIRLKEEKALELMLENKKDKAGEELMAAGEKLKKITGAKYDDYDITIFKSLIDELALLDEQSSRKLLEEIKIEFLNVKSAFQAGKYLNKINEIEKTISRLDRLENNDWRKAQENIRTLTEELILLYIN